MLSDTFQKLKWDLLARHKPWYYIWSTHKDHDESRYRQSGKDDVSRLIQQDALLKQRMPLSEATVLEIGCGNGRMSEFIAPLVKQLYAVDIAPTMIELATERIGHLKNTKFLVCSGSSFPITDESVDLVFSYIVFQHFATTRMVEQNIRDVIRVLKKTGIAKIQVRGVAVSGGPLGRLKWYYGASFSKAELERLLNKLGVRPLRWEGEGGKEFWVTFEK